MIPQVKDSPIQSSQPGESSAGQRAYPKRLIEVDLPIARISAHARREKSIRHGHISTLHIWWARRPLAACRAVICAALWPDPADPLCPPAFRVAAVEAIKGFAQRVWPERITQEERQLKETSAPESLARWERIAAGTLTLDAGEPGDWPLMRLCLLDFIADFANWANSTVPAYLETSRALTQAAHEALGGEPGTRPLVVDPFAGGGSIPLEALRVGADAFASDLNPVAVLLNKVVLEYIPKYGQRLADEVRKLGLWVKQEAEKELAEFYPEDAAGAKPIAYIWARTIKCEGPGCGVEVPVTRSLWLAKKGSRAVGLQLIPKRTSRHVDIRIIAKRNNTWVDQDDSDVRIDNPIFDGTAKRGSVTCPCCNFTTPVASVRRQLKERKGGAGDARLLCVVRTRPGQSGRVYQLPRDVDIQAINRANIELMTRVSVHNNYLSLVPNEPLPVMSGVFNAPLYGHSTWGSLFTPRQCLALSTLARLISESTVQLGRDCDDITFTTAVQTCLAFNFSRVADLSNSLCGWKLDVQCPTHLFSRQAIPMTWDFCESVCTSESSGSWSVMTERFVNILSSIGSNWPIGSIEQATATAHPLPDDSATAFVTDPPYYNAVPYADLSDFFYVWFRRMLTRCYPALFSNPLTPKEEEACEMAGWDATRYSYKDSRWFEQQMSRALVEGRRVLQPSGIGTIVFAHKSTAGWESLLQALIDAGWVVTASWPIDTEMGTRLRARDSAALASSVHLVCRPRENVDGTPIESIGEWRDVLGELPKRINEWMPRLAAEGVVGADAIFACLGPALEIFSRYSRVEKSNGETATLREYLEFVWAAVASEALALIFKDADAAGLEPDARLTAMWLWTLGGGGTVNGNGKRSLSADETEDEVSDDDTDEPEVTAKKGAKVSGFALEFDAARKIAQGLGVHLEQCISLVEVKGDKARLLPVSERTQYLFGKGAQSGAASGRRNKKVTQRTLFGELDEAESAEAGWTAIKGPPPGSTVLDRVHQAMILFAANRGELLKRFLLDDGVGKDARFWKLADNLNKLYPSGTDERRWVEGVLARKKGLGL